jgi:hypothetical protein
MLRGRVVAQLVLDRVRLVLLGEDLVLLRIDLPLVARDQRIEERRHLADAVDDAAHVLLQRLEG